jgi:hypothetical protein
MERIYSYPEQRESILLGYDDDPSTSERKSDVDFNDVFGGPPRRRSSVNESVSGEESETGWCSWPPESEREKPVFGEDSGIRSRRRYPNKKAKDFFDDIFGGEESQPQSGSSTPKKRDGAAFSPALQPLASSLPTSSSFFRFFFSLFHLLFKLVKLKSILWYYNFTILIRSNMKTIEMLKHKGQLS